MTTQTWTWWPRWTRRQKTVAALGVTTLLLIALETGTVGFAVGMTLAVLPVPLYAALALWLDRFEAEPRSLLLRAFFWGAAGAVFISMVVTTVFEVSLAPSVGEEAASLAGTVVSAPVVEELSKAVVLFLFFFRHRDEFDNVTDGIVYAAMVGLGFAMTENVQYYGNALNEGVDSSMSTFVMRGMLSPFAHPFFTAMTGIGLGVARETRGALLKGAAPLAGLFLAIVLHAAWNLSASADVFFPVYFGVMVPVFMGVLLLVRRSIRREGCVLRAHLSPCVEAGLLTAEEVAVLCTTRGRTRASLGALRRGGVRAWRHRGEMQQAVSELAFHRWRVERGISRGAELDGAREGELLSRIGALRAAAAS